MKVKNLNCRRSTDGYRFVTIRLVMAEIPGKNIYSEEDRSFEAQSTTVYYRIKEKD